jgi:hypothetical protein
MRDQGCRKELHIRGDARDRNCQREDDGYGEDLSSAMALLMLVLNRLSMFDISPILSSHWSAHP